MSWRRPAIITCLIVLIALAPLTASAQDPCAGNRIANASFEEGVHNDGNGLPASSVVANGWNGWSVWGYSSTSRQAEFDVENITLLGVYSTYRVHSGNFSQKFSTAWGTHNAGVYQRVAVPKGSTVTFSTWVQIYTGENTNLISNGQRVSDLDRPGNYRAYVGIDPFGEEPGMVGQPPSQRTVWSTAVVDRDTRQVNAQGYLIDTWVQLKVTVKAEADHVTVFTRGEPEFGVHSNVSYWDDACLTYVAPKPVPTAAPEHTNTPKPTTPPTATPLPPASATPTETPTVQATATRTLSPSAIATATLPPTKAASPTIAATPTRAAPAVSTVGGATDNPFLLFLFAAVWLSAAGYLGWGLYQKRRGKAPKPGEPPAP